MAGCRQEPETERDLGLSEAQRGRKAKYPPLLKKYEYLDHTADVQLHAWGETLEEAFEQCAMAMFGYITDTETVEPLRALEVEAEGHDMLSLLFHFLDEWLYKFSAEEFFVPREVKVLHIDRTHFKIRSIGAQKSKPSPIQPCRFLRMRSRKSSSSSTSKGKEAAGSCTFTAQAPQVLNGRVCLSWKGPGSWLHGRAGGAALVVVSGWETLWTCPVLMCCL